MTSKVKMQVRFQGKTFEDEEHGWKWEVLMTLVNGEERSHVVFSGNEYFSTKKLAQIGMQEGIQYTCNLLKEEFGTEITKVHDLKTNKASSYVQ
jgi:hypothetical protein